MPLTTQTKLAIAVVVLASAAGVAWYQSRGTPLPGKNKPAEIIDPETKQRVATTWDKVFHDLSPVRAPAGYWLVNYPKGSEKWCFVVDPGEPLPDLKDKGGTR